MTPVLKYAFCLFAGWTIGFISTNVISSKEPSTTSAATQTTKLNASRKHGMALPPSALRNDQMLDPFNYTKPLVFFDIEISGGGVGQIIFELFTKQAPLAAENFRALFTGEMGRVPNFPDRMGAGTPLHFKGKEFYRVVKDLLIQTGTSTESIYGGEFKDDPVALLLKHERGSIAVVNSGLNTSTSHFAILLKDAPYLDGKSPVFGRVVQGMDVVEKINALAPLPSSKSKGPIKPVFIRDCGELSCTAAFVCQKVEKDVARV